MYRFRDIRTTRSVRLIKLSLECRITLNGEERWVRNVVIRGEIEDSEYAMIFLRDITEAKVESTASADGSG